MTIEMSEESRGRIVVGIDGSDASHDALRWAVRLAPTLDARIDAIVAWEFPIMTGWEGVTPPPFHPEENAIQILKESLDTVFGPTHPEDVAGRVMRGHASAVLLEASKNAEMLIVGSRGLGGFAGLLLGSVSSSCAEHATCPVLVVHGQK